MPPKILIIGAGLTGSLCAFGIKKALPMASVTIWDKARGGGGRMTTTRTDTNNNADNGAQYITISSNSAKLYQEEYALLKPILQPLTARIEGLKPFPEDTKHYMAPQGMGSVVKHVLSQTSAQVLFNKQVKSLKTDDFQCEVLTQDGLQDSFDIVISTMPINQFLALSCDFGYEKLSLETVEYSSRFVLNWFYDKPFEPPTDWVIKYLDDDVFRYISWDNHKRNQPQENASVVFHTSVDFGKKNKLKSKEEMEVVLEKRARELFPTWPTPVSRKCHKWLYSQVTDPYKSEKGCVVLREKPTVILAGDGFTSSNVEGCILSARDAVQAACQSGQS